MSKIFDNEDATFEEGLHAILTNAGVERADFCTGYFNLRGWKSVAADVQSLPGGEALESDGKGGEASVRRVCRLLSVCPLNLKSEIYQYPIALRARIWYTMCKQS